MRIGIHTSIGGSLDKAAARAQELGANTFQIFSASPRMWRAGMPDPSAIRRMRELRERHDLTPLVIHDNYLINLASADRLIRRKSIAAFRGEMERAIAIGAEYLVAHPGNYKGQSLEEGIVNLVRGLGEAAAGLEPGNLTLLLENTAGCGAQIGYRFEELRAIRDLASTQLDFEIGYCIDTCHCLAAGYDVSTPSGLRSTLQKLESELGLVNVKVIHSNDSKTPLGSHVDRHAHIGEGYIGLEGFRRILNHPKLSKKPFILETPIDQEGDDLRNVQTLKKLCRKSRTTTTPSK
ncbi:MAG: deoxyribonuclease IV [Bryobacteraceae bacterium]|nr:deoxyribonuclease IV [Bryobacterales bacterium]MEB2359871.1 deoxyribonuclease IV [Bryobacterales bacterium]NUN00788.1 deoxyribonuclease IV [Bryobacteraceae bacterium]